MITAVASRSVGEPGQVAGRTPAAPPLVLITRPGAPGRALAEQFERLVAGAGTALWWPAFDLLPPVDPQAVAATVAQLDDFDLVIFVSPQAVYGLAVALQRAGMRAWPARSRVAVVGTATRRAAQVHLPGQEQLPVIGPDGTAATGGSEALWPALERLLPPPARALIVGAQTGRPWLRERLASRGTAVDQVEVYLRRVHTPSQAEHRALDAGLAAAGRVAVLVSSSEAVIPVDASLRAHPGWDPAAAGSLGLAVHPRIGAALRARGWPRVQVCAPQADAIIEALGGDLCPRPAAAAGAR